MRVFVFVILIGLYSSLFAQTPNSELSIQAGLAIPTGDLGSKSNSINSGYASTGRTLSLGLNYPLMKGLYLAFSYSNSTFNIDRTAFDDITRNNLIDSISISRPVTEEFTYRSSLEKYVNNNLSLGLKIDMRINDKWNAFVIPSATYNWFKLPDLAIVVTDSALEVASAQSADVTGEFAISLTTGVDYRISEELKVTFGANFLHSEHNPNIIAEARNQNNDMLRAEANETTIYSAVSFMFGLNIQLGSSKEE